MTTQVIFKIDKKLKEQAMNKARNQGVPFASVLKLATQAFVSGQLDVGLVGTETLNMKTRKEVSQALKDFAKRKNTSPAFSSAKEAINYLRKSDGSRIP